METSQKTNPLTQGAEALSIYIDRLCRRNPRRPVTDADRNNLIDRCTDAIRAAVGYGVHLGLQPGEIRSRFWAEVGPQINRAAIWVPNLRDLAEDELTQGLSGYEYKEAQKKAPVDDVSSRTLSDAGADGQTHEAHSIYRTGPSSIQGGDVDAPSHGARPDPTLGSVTTTPRHRKPDLARSLARLALIQQLTQELGTLQPEVAHYHTVPGLKYKHPNFELWKHLDNGQINELLKGARFYPKRYASNLVAEHYGIGLHTLKYDRKKLKKAGKLPPGW